MTDCSMRNKQRLCEIADGTSTYRYLTISKQIWPVEILKLAWYLTICMSSSLVQVLEQ